MVKAYAALEAGAELTPFEFSYGELADNEVEIGVHYCGLCASDVSMINNSWGRSVYPLVPGHEVIGEIVATGSQVKSLAPGDAVGLGWHADYCMACQTCLGGDHNLCSSAAPTIIGRHGGFAERVRANAASVVKLPPGTDAATAGPLFCGGITVFNPLLEYAVKPTDRVGVVGIGGLGHLALKFLRAWGCEATAFTSSASKRDEALAMGAVATIDSTNAEEIKAHAGTFDLILSTVGANLDWTALVETLRPRGRLHLVGVPSEPVAVPVPSLLRQQKAISASPVGSPKAIAQMLEFAARHDIRPQVEEFSVEDINAAIAHLRDGKARYRVVINMRP